LSYGSGVVTRSQQVIENGGLHPYQEVQSEAIALSAGYHDIRVEFFENLGAAGVQLFWDPPGATGKQLVPNSVLFRDARDVFNVETDADVVLDGFTGQVQAIGAGDVTPVIGNGLSAQVFDLAAEGIAPANEILTFDGVDDVVSIASSESLNPARQVTVEARFKIDGFTNSYMPIVSKGTSTERNYGLFVGDDGSLALIGGGDLIFSGSGLVSQGAWYEVAGVIDRDALDGQRLKLYLNGTEVASGGTLATDIVANDSPLLFGEWLEPTFDVSSFQGQIEEVAVWGSARTLDEIGDDFGGIDPAHEDLAGHWKLAENGDAVLDASANANHGVLGDGADPARNPLRVAIIREFPDFDGLTPVFDHPAVYGFAVVARRRFRGVEVVPDLVNLGPEVADSPQLQCVGVQIGKDRHFPAVGPGRVGHGLPEVPGTGTHQLP